ncbi:MAG TPA: hypothetical protein VF495_10595, partial [Phenylobacterium sp.]
MKFARAPCFRFVLICAAPLALGACDIRADQGQAVRSVAPPMPPEQAAVAPQVLDIPPATASASPVAQPVDQAA